jgi:hypothetical protein
MDGRGFTQFSTTIYRRNKRTPQNQKDNSQHKQQQKLRKLKAKQQTQELLNAAHSVSDGGVPLGKLIKEGHQDPMVARVRFEYAALLRELVNQCGYDNFDVDGDHGILVINR